MAIQTLNPGVNTGGQLGSILGQGLGVGGGSALGGLLEGLAEAKAQQLQQSHTENLLKQAGYAPRDIALAKLIPPQDFYKFISSYQPHGQQDQQQSGLQNVMQHLESPQQQLTIQDLFGSQGANQNAIMRSVGQTPINQEQLLQSILGNTQQQPQQVQSQQTEPQPMPMLETQRRAPGTFENPQQRVQRELVERKGEQAKEREILKKELKQEEKSGELAASTIQDLQAARDRLHDITEMKKLNESGKLVDPTYYSTLKHFGLDKAALLNPESEQFLALQKNFLRDMKRYFGARVSNFEVEQFLKAIPTLSNTQEGRARVLESLEYFEKSKVAYAKSLQEVYEENPKAAPYKIQLEAFKRSEKKIDKIAKKFNENMDKITGNSFDSLPNAKSYSGKRIKDDQTGITYRSNGSKWVKE